MNKFYFISGFIGFLIGLFLGIIVLDAHTERCEDLLIDTCYLTNEVIDIANMQTDIIKECSAKQLEEFDIELLDLNKLDCKSLERSSFSLFGR